MWPSGAGASVGRSDPRTPHPSGRAMGTRAYVFFRERAVVCSTPQGDLVSAVFSSGALEHPAHPSAVFSLLWPPGGAFLPSEQAEQRPLGAPVSSKHSRAWSPRPRRVTEARGPCPTWWLDSCCRYPSQPPGARMGEVLAPVKH